MLILAQKSHTSTTPNLPKLSPHHHTTPTHLQPIPIPNMSQIDEVLSVKPESGRRRTKESKDALNAVLEKIVRAPRPVPVDFSGLRVTSVLLDDATHILAKMRGCPPIRRSRDAKDAMKVAVQGFIERLLNGAVAVSRRSPGHASTLRARDVNLAAAVAQCDIARINSLTGFDLQAAASAESLPEDAASPVAPVREPKVRKPRVKADAEGVAGAAVRVRKHKVRKEAREEVAEDSVERIRRELAVEA